MRSKLKLSCSKSYSAKLCENTRIHTSSNHGATLVQCAVADMHLLKHHPVWVCCNPTASSFGEVSHCLCSALKVPSMSLKLLQVANLQLSRL